MARNICLFVLVLAIMAMVLLAGVVNTAYTPRYFGMGETSAAGWGPSEVVTQWRGDRWTGFEEYKRIQFGQSSGWQVLDWRPWDVWLVGTR